jgi:predicted dehydrogenase/threonine dehydrogenase-like Zn-dependent dehydrogenase
MKQVLIRSGRAEVEEVPSPMVEHGGVLVRVESSCISIGTEMSGVRTSGMPLWKRALEQPDNLKKVIQLATTQGISKTRSLVSGKLAGGSPTGYSAAGVVLEVGEGVTDLRPGDRVACAGAQCAFHAEVIQVPRNLCVPTPEGLSSAEASTVTLGAIALQGVRRASPTLGETFVVIGLGVLGQLTSQLLQANGCRVVGVDPDRARVEQALALGMHAGVDPQADSDISHVARLTGGLGADGVIITAATPSDEVIATAFRMCRKKGRVVLVGDVGLHLNRSDFYVKELDFFISTSYGPGRYDERYEEKGVDYPIGYVRWTENRNMEEFLRLLAEGKVRVAPMIEATYPIEEATQAYESLSTEGRKPLMVLLSYPPAATASDPARTIPTPGVVRARPGIVRIAVVGAGGFAKSMHLPNLQSLPDRFHVQAIVSRTGHNARSTAKQFGADYSTTDYDAVLGDPEVDAVLISTRPKLHAGMALSALRAGKHVLLEKPLALTREELDGIRAFYEGARPGEGPILLTGFNRRFSPLFTPLQAAARKRTNPLIANYAMNAGYIPLDDWSHGEDNGSRNLSEACHIYDLFTALTESRVVEVTARAIEPSTDYYTHRDNFIALLRFDDGSVTSLTYTALGSKKHPKERMEVFLDGGVLVLDDYLRFYATGVRAPAVKRTIADKGQKDEVIAFADAIQKGGEWPIPLWQQVQATEIALTVEQQINGADGLHGSVEKAPEEAAPAAVSIESMER